MDTQPYLRSQVQILADVEAMFRDTSNARWSDAEIYRAVNRALLTWYDRVAIAHYYTISGGYSAGTYGYSLPAYVRPPVTAEAKRWVPYDDYTLDTQTAFTYVEVPSIVEPDGSGGLVLRLVQPPRTLDGRVRWRMPNGPLPTTLPTLNADMTSSDTTLTMSGAIDVEDAGYVKIDAEWVAYAGVTRGTSTTTLNNLLRGLNGTTAATHDGTGDPDDVVWGVAVDTLGLYEQLYNQVGSYLHEYFLTDGSEKERLNHEKMMGYLQQKADGFWKRYQPKMRPNKLMLSQRMVYRT